MLKCSDIADAKNPTLEQVNEAYSKGFDFIDVACVIYDAMDTIPATYYSDWQKACAIIHDLGAKGEPDAVTI